MSERLAEIKARLAKATPGPWCWESVAEKANEFIVGVGCDENGNPFSGQVPKDEWVEDVVIERRTFVGSNEFGQANFGDAEFIAHAPDDIRWLCDQLEAATGGKLEEGLLEDERRVIGESYAGMVQLTDLLQTRLAAARQRVQDANRLISEVLLAFVDYVPVDGSKDTRWMKEAQNWLLPVPPAGEREGA